MDEAAGDSKIFEVGSGSVFVDLSCFEVLIVSASVFDVFGVFV